MEIEGKGAFYFGSKAGNHMIVALILLKDSIPKDRNGAGEGGDNSKMVSIPYELEQLLF